MWCIEQGRPAAAAPTESGLKLTTATVDSLHIDHHTEATPRSAGFVLKTFAPAAPVGTTRSRVNFFMNRFRKLGLIDYNGHIRVHKSLSQFLLQDAVRLPVDPFAAATGAATERSSPPKSTRPKRPANQPTHPTPPPV
jgi:hypothetical protein